MAILLLIVVGNPALTTCGDVGGRALLDDPERTAIEAYGSRARAVQSARAPLMKAWSSLREAATQKRFAERIHAELLPAFRNWLDRLKAIKPALPELAKTHDALVQAYGVLERGLTELSSSARNDPREKVAARLDRLLAAARAAEATYAREVERIYAARGVSVIVATPPGPTGGGGS